jgi:hypothetical protein
VQKFFQHQRLINQTPFHQMTVAQHQQLFNLNTAMSSLLEELQALMTLDHDI